MVAAAAPRTRTQRVAVAAPRTGSRVAPGGRVVGRMGGRQFSPAMARPAHAVAQRQLLDQRARMGGYRAVPGSAGPRRFNRATPALISAPVATAAAVVLPVVIAVPVAPVVKTVLIPFSVLQAMGNFKACIYLKQNAAVAPLEVISYVEQMGLSGFDARGILAAIPPQYAKAVIASLARLKFDSFSNNILLSKLVIGHEVAVLDILPPPIQL